MQVKSALPIFLLPTYNDRSSRFIVLGCVTVFAAISVVLLVPDTPMQCRFLSDAEKVSLLEHIRINQTGVENRRFSPRQLLEAFLDLRLWCIWLLMLLQGGSGGVITTYSATLIKGFGYSSRRAALLNMGTGPVIIVCALGCSYGVRRFGHRGLWIMLVTSIAAVGDGLLSWLPPTRKGGLLAGIYMVNALTAATTLTYQWTVANVAGHTKRAVATAVLNAFFAVGNIIGPQTFQARDAPGYGPAKEAAFGMTLAVTVLALGLYSSYWWENRQRRLQDGEQEVSDQQAYAGLTDKENKLFRYEY